MGCSSKRTAGGILVAAGERGLVDLCRLDYQTTIHHRKSHSPTPYISYPKQTRASSLLSRSPGSQLTPATSPRSHRTGFPAHPSPDNGLEPLSHRRSNTLVAITFDSMPAPTYKELTSAGKFSYLVHFK